MNYKRIRDFIIKQLKPYKKRLFIIFICMLLVTAIGMIVPLLSRTVFDQGIMSQDIRIVVRVTLIIILLNLLENGISFIQFAQYEHINQIVPFKLLMKTFNHSMKIRPGYYRDNNFYKIIDNAFMDINNISQIVNANIMMALLNAFKVAGGCIGLMIISWKLTLFVLLIIPLQLAATKYISAHRKKLMAELMKNGEKFGIWFSETLNSVELVKLWNLYRQKRKEFVRIRRSYIETNSKMDYLDQFSMRFGSIVNSLLSNGILILGAVLLFRNSLTIGGLFAFNTYTAFLVQSAASLSDILYNLAGNLPAFERYMNFFDNETEVKNGIQVPADKNNNVQDLVFENVALSYHQNQVLHSVSFHINKGEKAAFVGLNGSGKSSILNLILRFFEPDSGSIQINGRDIKNYDLYDYRDLFSVMDQNTRMFNSTVRENIDLQGNLNDREINEIIKLTNLNVFIDGLPNGLDTRIGYNGTRLSGGERQKIALARTLCKKGKILILDEATASFDLNSELMFNDYISATDRYDMVIVVTHRTDILKKLDKIFVVEGGRISDFGTYRELCSRNADFEKKYIHNESERWRNDERDTDAKCSN